MMLRRANWNYSIATCRRTTLLARRRFASLALPPKSSGYGRVVGAFATGLAIGGLYTFFGGEKAAVAEAPAVIDRSTSPLDTLDTPRYANEDEFNTALDKIKRVVGAQNTSLDADVISSHADTFFSTHHPPKPDQKPHTVIYPENTDQVSQVLKIAHEYRVPVVATSGLTSLEGQMMHTRGPYSISLNFGHMDQVLAVHEDDLDAVVQAGVGWQDLDEHLLSSDKSKHLMFGPDPGMGATIAGMVATSASGTNAYKYGTMKENVVNLTVVLADGTVLKTKQRPRKSSAGYDLTRLFIGSEGTLGVITEITVKLHVRPVKELVSIASFPTIKDATSAAQEILSRSGLQPNAIEILDSTMMSFVNEAQTDGAKQFLENPTLFFKIGGANQKVIEDQTAVIQKIAEKNNLIKYEQSTDESENAVLWQARRNGLWSTIQFGAKILPDKDDVQLWTTDIAVPISKLSQVISETNDDLNNSGYFKKFAVMGHIGDGNCHFLILYNTPDYRKTQEIVDRMVERAIGHGGTCTGEHGVGVGKRKYLVKELGTTSVDLMRHIKLLLDPRRILNPDKIIKIDPNDDLDRLLDHGLVKEAGCCHE
ncbi:mitochondrial D-lactate ferricytochrome c oxidoreductase [Suhomyces tanzawaensis NRRL Y-17324]|uniref:D-lactate dehydrogenase (cytochrome) n=1 Tax=Suhomyces tanzawaensis NRRL Y-17324 TaxID=984487 RepID=A0A1E4SS30_9ASCO|nr:mitochondrial D-lactate ferricytochrome c oxidoreductase [Suhomyces tanzawaensis NRRL Y-17324]ODV82314.1 mitochondrial D-lactate ferricytochrome c oxidoreductase [Suhomyces tanzawaensis NRRL Y-17324]